MPHQRKEEMVQSAAFPFRAEKLPVVERLPQVPHHLCLEGVQLWALEQQKQATVESSEPKSLKLPVVVKV